MVTYRRWARALCACLMLSSPLQAPLFHNPSLERSFSTASSSASTSERSAVRISKAARLLHVNSASSSSPSSPEQEHEHVRDPLEALLFDERPSATASESDAAATDVNNQRANLHLVVDRRRAEGSLAVELDRWLRREFNAIRFAHTNAYTNSHIIHRLELRILVVCCCIRSAFRFLIFDLLLFTCSVECTSTGYLLSTFMLHLLIVVRQLTTSLPCVLET